MRPLLVSVLFAFGVVLAFCQNDISIDQIDEENRLAFSLYSTNPVEMVEIGKRMLEESRRISYESGIASSYHTIGLGYLSIGDYALASENLHLSMERFEELGAKEQTANILGNLGVVHYYLKDHKKSLAYHQESLALQIEIGDSSGFGKSYNNLGIAFRNLGQLDQSLDYYQKALAEKERVSDSAGVANTLNNIGNIYLEKKELSKAEKYYMRSLQIDRNLDRTRGVATSFANLGKVKMDQGKFNESDRDLNEAIELSKSIGSDQVRLLALEYQAELFEKMGNADEALSVLKKWVALNDSLHSADSERSIREIEGKYENAKILAENEALKSKEALQSAELHNQRMAMWSGAGAIGLLLITSLIVYRSNRIRGKLNKELNVKNDELSAKTGELESLNRAKTKMLSVLSHDVKAPLNNLNSLLALVKMGAINREDEAKFADQMSGQIDTISRLMSNILEWVKTQMDGITVTAERLDLSEEIEKVMGAYGSRATEKRLELKCTNMAGIHVFADKNLLRSVLQNLIGNGIKFTSDGSVEVSCLEKGKEIEVRVKDTGVGIPEDLLTNLFNLEFYSTSGTLHEEGTGIGLLLVKEFVERNGGTVSVESEVGVGTSFIFTLQSA